MKNIRVFLQLKNSREDDSPHGLGTILYSMYEVLNSFLENFHSKPISFEIYNLGGNVYFYITAPFEKYKSLQRILISTYPKCEVIFTKDPLQYIEGRSGNSHITKKARIMSLNVSTTDVELHNSKQIDVLIGYLSALGTRANVGYQVIFLPKKIVVEKTQDKIVSKSTKEGYVTKINIIANCVEKGENIKVLSDIHSILRPLGIQKQNILRFLNFYQKNTMQNVFRRKISILESLIGAPVSVEKLALFWQLPNRSISYLNNIVWGTKIGGELPKDMATAKNISDKNEINFFGKVLVDDKNISVGIKNADRRRHMYILGKTGMGKSTLIANMVIDDIRRGRGVGIIDPHGDLTDIILDFIPKHRLKDVVYIDPSSEKSEIHFNIFENISQVQTDIVASSIVSIFAKIYGGTSWGPRLEYILRNVVYTLLETEGATLPDALKILSNKSYRSDVVAKLKNNTIFEFWINEFEKMPDRLKAEAISPLQNKIGQFVQSEIMKRILSHSKSNIDFPQIMNEGKILIINLSQGKLGEDNASLLGALFITQLQLTAMSRASIDENARVDFYLFVDEFQNFATNSFVKILSEARKYRFSLILANQYIKQIGNEIIDSILGNVGSILAFQVGIEDATLLKKEFNDIFSVNEISTLGKYKAIAKIAIDGISSRPFLVSTLPLPSNKNMHKSKILRFSEKRIA